MKLIVKISKFLLKVEKWFLDKCIEKDTLEYEDYLYTIKNTKKKSNELKKKARNNLWA